MRCRARGHVALYVWRVTSYYGSAGERNRWLGMARARSSIAGGVVRAVPLPASRPARDAQGYPDVPVKCQGLASRPRSEECVYHGAEKRPRPVIPVSASAPYFIGREPLVSGACLRRRTGNGDRRFPAERTSSIAHRRAGRRGTEEIETGEITKRVPVRIQEQPFHSPTNGRPLAQQRRVRLSRCDD